MSPYAGEPPLADKRAIRAQLRALRRARVPGRDRAADGAWIARIGTELVDSLGLGAGSWVSSYEACPTEPPTDVLIDRLRALGIRVMVPITLPDLDLDWCEAGEPGRPLGPAAIADAAVVFLPAHGVDRHGTRIGQGGGSYDRAIPRALGRSRLVAIVHPWEVLDEDLPREAHDQPVHAVIAAGEGLRSLAL
jgi:5-formyltetrahydrofolate cyclo-ligase